MGGRHTAGYRRSMKMEMDSQTMAAAHQKSCAPSQLELAAGGPNLPRLPSRASCSICSGPIEPHKPVAYLHTGAVVHVRCRILSRGAAANTVAIVQPSTHAMHRHVREVRAAARATRAMLRGVAADAGRTVAT
jgi:hypothetical protein